MKHDFYVYLHRKLNDNSVFYVGKGKGKRAYIKHGRSEKWKRTVAKYGYRVDILIQHVDEPTAFKKEVELINYFRSINHNLCNLTDGGEGASGAVISEKHRKKLSEKRKQYISKNREKVIASILKASRVKSEKPLSKETLERMAEAQRGKKQKKETIDKRQSHFKTRRAFCDDALYLFVNEENEVFLGKRFELAETLNTDPHFLRNLFLKENSANSAKGWMVIKDYMTFQLFVSILNTI